MLVKEDISHRTTSAVCGDDQSVQSDDRRKTSTAEPETELSPAVFGFILIKDL